jgi:LysM repeat protein
MADRRRPRRSSSRYLAPLALAATCAGIYLIVSNGLHSGSSPQGSGNASASHRSPSRSGPGGSPATGRSPASGPRFYVVRSGDTLSEISVRTHVPVATIQRLNPRITANSLQVGQRLRLRR